MCYVPILIYIYIYNRTDVYAAVETFAIMIIDVRPDAWQTYLIQLN